MVFPGMVGTTFFKLFLVGTPRTSSPCFDPRQFPSTNPSLAHLANSHATLQALFPPPLPIKMSEHVFQPPPTPFSKHQSQPDPPSDLACNLAGTFPNHHRPSKFPSTFSNLHPHPPFPSTIPSTRQPRMQPRRHFSQPPPPIKISKHFFQAADAFGFPSGVLPPMCENFFFGPMPLSAPHLELHLAIYNQQSKKFSGIVKVEKYFLPRGFATCVNTLSTLPLYERGCYHIVVLCVVLWCGVWCSGVICFGVLWCAMMCCAEVRWVVWCFVVSAVVWCAVLRCAMLCVLHGVVLCCVVLRCGVVSVLFAAILMK